MEALGAEGLLVSPTGGPWGDKGVRPGRPRASVSPQTERKFGPGMGQKRTESGQLSVCARALGRLVCPFYPKRTEANRIGSRGGVGLT